MSDALMTLRVLAVILLGGAIVVDTLAGVLMQQSRGVAELRGFARLSRINQFIGIAAIVVIPVFGYLTANELDLALDTTWLLVGQILFWVAVAALLGLPIPGAFRIARRVQALPDGPVPR